ncbi:NAD(P)-dependent oxidoreductase [Clostridium sediminicola]|uniref:NAD-dependent epimerase/dehydratase family protein n=1 Tax=Clostridium sediminicola TaxID=3114879 RepID=UPI0031F217AA
MENKKINLIGKKALVTGAAGFIGSHLVRRLLEEGAQVAVIVRKSTKLWKLNDIKNHISICYGDIQDKDSLEKIISSYKPEYVFHLAAYGVNSQNKDYYKAIRTNIVGSVNIMELLSKTGSEKIINIGSSSEYGLINGPQTEDGVLNPLNIYGSTKAAATIIMHQIARTNDQNIVTIRPFGLFGEREEQHKIFSFIITSILKGQEVKLTSCQQFRDYIYVENLVDAMILACKSGIKNEIFNIGSGKVEKLEYYVNKIFELTKSDLKPKYGYYTQREGDMWCPCPNVDKIKTLLQWDIKISFEKGLNKTINWFEKNLEYY